MGTELATIYTSGPAEYTDLVANTLDFTDWPCGPTTTCPTVSSGSSTLITAPVAAVEYYEIQFNLANNFWGINMNFGNNVNGTLIRQAIAHMIDKTIFVTSEQNLIGTGVAIDNPLPPSIGGSLPSPNPCAWDTNFPQSGSQCVVGAAGGTAYHLASATGADSIAWLQAPTSPDLCAAASELITAGIATGTVGYGAGAPSAATCATAGKSAQLTGISSSASGTGHVPTFFVRSDDVSRNDLGNSLADEICWMFTGSYTVPCTYLNSVPGPITAFPGFQTNPTGLTINWWMYTAGYIGGTFFDSSLYLTYNSRFVDSYNCTGQPGCSTLATPFPLAQTNGGQCNNGAVATASAADYMYLCNKSYDSLSNQMEFAPCLDAAGEPGIWTGQTSNTPGYDCPSTTQLSAISAGIQAEDAYGKGAYTIPIYTEKDQFGYLNDGWIQAINSASSGLPNFFTWLNAYNPTPAQANTIRQGFAETTKSLSPYIASTVWDFYIISNMMDSLYGANPLSPTQLMNWMTISTAQEANSQLNYVPPTGTVTTYRFTLIPGLTFQDGNPVTSFDVAFSYLSLLATGAFVSGAASSVIGITILGPHQFDFNINSVGPFTLTDITGLPIFQGQYWAAAQSTWNTALSTCLGSSSASCYPVQYGLAGSPPAITCTLAGCSTFSAATMTWNSGQIGASYDPLKAGILSKSGSSAWTNLVSSSGAQNPGPKQSYTLSAYPNYVKSSSNLALWVWAADGSATGPSLLTYSTVSACYGAVGTPVGIDASVPPTTGAEQGCAHWQQGIGGPGESTVAGSSNQVISPGSTGTALSSDTRLEYVGPTPFGGHTPTNDTIVYNVNGGSTFTSGDIVIGCVSTSACTPPTAASLVGTTLNMDTLLRFYDNTALNGHNGCVAGAWCNGKSVVYDTDNSGGYDWGDVSSSINGNAQSLYITPNTGISIPPPPTNPGGSAGNGCPAVGVAGTTASGCWFPSGGNQISEVYLRISLNWVNPYNWLSSPPLGIGTFPPTLHQPNTTVPLSPDSVSACTSSFNATSTNSGTTVGGYDC
jgi:ABC-type transport system substrate-binding protein